MIELYTWTTPNGRKASIMLEEIGAPYTVHRVNIGRQEQFDPAFLEISPNNKIPAIVDNDGPEGPLSAFESGAILIYLAEKSGKLLASQGAERYKALEWLNWQMGGIGPMFGQLGFFAIRSTEKSALAIRHRGGSREASAPSSSRRLGARFSPRPPRLASLSRPGRRPPPVRCAPHRLRPRHKPSVARPNYMHFQAFPRSQRARTNSRFRLRKSAAA
jgi:glutathione S-transferase